MRLISMFPKIIVLETSEVSFVGPLNFFNNCPRYLQLGKLAFIGGGLTLKPTSVVYFSSLFNVIIHVMVSRLFQPNF